MQKEFPDRISVKSKKCPVCKEKLGGSNMVTEGNVVRMLCPKDGCDHGVDLFWIGDLKNKSN